MNLTFFESKYIKSLEALCRESLPLINELDLLETPGPYTLPPEIYDFTPTTKDIYRCFKTPTEGDVLVRQLFQSSDLSEFERQLLENLEKVFNQRQITIPEYLNQYLLRVCCYNFQKYKQEDYILKAYQHLLEMNQWRRTTFPLSDRDEVLLNHLRKGAIYWEGRDHGYRPLLVVRMERFTYPLVQEQLNKLIVFCFEWALKYLFVPGRVESCIVLFDIRYVSTYQFPLKMITSLIQLLTYQYPFRLNHMHILHDSLLLQSSWKIIQRYLSETQQQKLTFWRSSMGHALLKTFMPHQVEKDFGGLRDGIIDYYPFPLGPGPYHPLHTDKRSPSFQNNETKIQTPPKLSHWQQVQQHKGKDDRTEIHKNLIYDTSPHKMDSHETQSPKIDSQDQQDVTQTVDAQEDDLQNANLQHSDFLNKDDQNASNPELYDTSCTSPESKDSEKIRAQDVSTDAFFNTLKTVSLKSLFMKSDDSTTLTLHNVYEEYENPLNLYHSDQSKKDDKLYNPHNATTVEKSFLSPKSSTDFPSKQFLGTKLPDTSTSRLKSLSTISFNQLTGHGTPNYGETDNYARSRKFESKRQHLKNRFKHALQWRPFAKQMSKM